MGHIGRPVIIIVKKSIPICPNALRRFNRFLYPEPHAFASLDWKAGVDVIRRCKEALQECCVGPPDGQSWMFKLSRPAAPAIASRASRRVPVENGNPFDLVAKWVWT